MSTDKPKIRIKATYVGVRHNTAGEHGFTERILSISNDTDVPIDLAGVQVRIVPADREALPAFNFPAGVVRLSGRGSVEFDKIPGGKIEVDERMMIQLVKDGEILARAPLRYVVQ